MADAPPPAKDGFVPTGPRQPAPGILWPVEHWASFGADAWDLDRRCVVCGGDLNGFDHARCWPSMDAASPGSLPLDDFRRQRRADPRNSTESTESVEFDWNLIERALDEVGGGRRGRWPAQLALEEGIRKILRISTQAADNFDMMTKAWGEAHGDSRLIDAVAAAGVVVRPLANDAERFGYELPDGKPHADGHFPSWRAAALAGLARAGVQIPTRGS